LIDWGAVAATDYGATHEGPVGIIAMSQRPAR
jgi:hypothetical protein